MKKVLILLFLFTPLFSFADKHTSEEATAAQEANQAAAEELDAEARANTPTNYQPLAPLPGLESVSSDQGLGEYIQVIFNLSIGLGAVLAVLMLVVGGFQYLSTDQFGTKSDAKDRIQNALMGLGLLLVSVIGLQTINPELLNLELDLETAESKFSLPAVNKFIIVSPEGEITGYRGLEEYCLMSSSKDDDKAKEESCHTNADECSAAKKDAESEDKEKEYICQVVEKEYEAPAGSFDGRVAAKELGIPIWRGFCGPVQLQNLDPGLYGVMLAVKSTYSRLSVDQLRINSGRDCPHSSAESLHHSGRALDFEIPNSYTKSRYTKIERDICSQLRSNYRVRYHHGHIHVAVGGNTTHSWSCAVNYPSLYSK